ncbi:MAG: hypothetical protein HRT71_06420 [Flavobacteriales bacterium]|nr:hypothetical protein [Flavobacteriales bacterium]
MRLILAFTFLVVAQSESCEDKRAIRKDRKHCDCPAMHALNENSSSADSVYFELCKENQLKSQENSNEI